MATNQVNDGGEKERLKQYKNVAKHEDMRRRRTECSVELRKQKREDALMKRRNIACDDTESESCTEDENNKEPAAQSTTPKTLAISQVVTILQNNPSLEQLRIAFESVRRLLSRTRDAPVDKVIQSGLIAALIRALYVEDEKVQFEAAWALTNIVSGTNEQTMAVVKEGAVEPLVALCSSSNLQVAEQSCWAVANIAGDSVETRDLVLEAGILEAVDELFSKLNELTVEFVRTLAWLHSNLCRHKSRSVDIGVLRVIAPRLKKCLVHEDVFVRQDACWALAYLTDGNDAQINVALECDCLRPATTLLMSTKDSEVAPALRVLGNFATGSDELTQVIVDSGVLDIVRDIMGQTKTQSILKECCWLLSNVIAGTQVQIDAVIKAKLIPPIINALENGDSRSRVEASWAIANLSQGGTARQISCLAKRDYLKAFCEVLSPSSHIDLLVNILETVYFLLTTLSNQDPGVMTLASACDNIEEFGGLDKLEELQQHPNEKVYSVAYKIIEQYFSEEDDNEDQINLSTNGHFDF
ncbi:unnamed protein product [Enterobius vermicularis]|uniref:Importin subunit alpha n=1 Tax=Enterobius vermicularis TaxID=51028 RepID=A0A0N4VH90_ENTVE|nr:unnamed protein product [Enterobius vermicularis]